MVSFKVVLNLEPLEHMLVLYWNWLMLVVLDIYHRILRFKNYSLAMMNKSLLPVKFQVPFVGE